LFLLKYRNHLDNLSNMESAKQEELALKAIQYAYKNLIDLKISILKIALMRSIFLSRKAIFSFADKLNVIFFLRHLKKELKTKLTHNQEAINYLNTRVNSFVNALTNSNFEKIIIKSIL